MKKAFGLVSGALSLMVLVLYVLSALWLQVNLNATLPSDLEIYVRAGRAVLQDKSAYYPFEIGLSYVYPPSALLLFAPLSLFPLDLVKLLWATINIIMYLGALTALWIVLRSAIQSVWLIWGMGGLLLYAPFMETLVTGQVNCLVLLGLALWVLGLVHNRYKWVGDIGLAIAIMVKITPLLLLAIPIVQLDWKRLLRVFAGIGVLAASSWLSFGLSPWIEFVDIFPKLFQEYAYLTLLLKGVANERTITAIGRTSSAILLAAWGSVLLWQAIASIGLSRKEWSASNVWAKVRTGPSFLWAEQRQLVASWVAWSITVMTVSSSLLWYHHLVFLVIPLSLLLLDGEKRTINWSVVCGGLVAFLIQAARVAEFRALGSWFLYAACLLLYVVLGARVVRCFRFAQD